MATSSSESKTREYCAEIPARVSHATNKLDSGQTAPWKEMMKVTHHLTETSFKDYVMDLDWKDLKPYCQIENRTGTHK